MKKAPLVLIIEDSPCTLELTSKALESSGFRTLRASCALEAVHAARREPPDVIVADVLLPDLDGATATTLLREEPEFRHVPVVFISGLPERELSGMIGDRADILSKPFRPGDLVRSVRRQADSNATR